MATLLRKMTRKSLMRFGKYSDLTVGELLDKTAHRYLRWVYFNSSNITFMDDILEEIKVLPEYRIEKPGVDRDMNEKLNEFMDTQMGFFNTQRAQKRKRVYNQIMERKALKPANKLALQMRNHGH